MNVDVAVVGGGPAGLAAALAAARMNCRVVCFEAGTPRTAHAPHYYNVLGFPEGISGEELLRRGREQASQWGAVIRDAAVVAIRHVDEGFTLEIRNGEPIRARGIVFATGVYDNQPSCGELYGKAPAVIHYCVVCDGYETRGQPVAVVGRDDSALETLASLRDFTTDLDLILDQGGRLGEEARARITDWNVRIHEGSLTSCTIADEGVRFALAGGRELVVAHAFLALGVTPKNDVAAKLGCALDEDGYIVTDERLATTVPFAYAAGDCNGGRKQVTQATAEGERAALELVSRMRLERIPVAADAR